jgi:uncharacterized CHY-type Zn-finger protein
VKNPNHKSWYYAESWQPDDELSEYAERQLDKMHRKSTNQVVCGHCASDMHMEELGYNAFQMSCSHCGTCGPRERTRHEAIESSLVLFPL